jgi:serine/threonine-protein kinase
MTDSPATTRLRCPECLAVFRTAFSYCPADGATLIECDDEPLIGARIADRYVLEELIGEGAMGLVYRASHVRLPRRFAIKVLFGDHASDTRMRLRFAQEASAACRLNHPNVVAAVDFGKSEGGLLYLVMDYVEGETLSDLIAREAPLPGRRVIELARQLCAGLAHAHANDVVHRDFKPDNVVLEPHEGGSPVPRILDFGLAITANDDAFDGRLTQHGWVVGTPAYLSPEQARDEQVDRRVDLYALGVVMYEMLAGVTPFEGAAMEVAHRNMLEPVPPIRSRNPAVHVAPELERIVRRLLEKSPEARFATAEEVIEALDRIDETFDYGVSEGMATLMLGDDMTAEPYLPFEELRPHPLRRGVAGIVAAAAAGLLVYLVAGDARRADGVAEMAAHPVEPAAVTEVAIADRPAVAPAEEPVTRPPPDSPPPPAAPPAESAEPVAPPPRAAAPHARKPARAPARQRTAVTAREPQDPLAPAAEDAGIADLDTAQLAAITTPASPRPGPEVSVERLIQEYRQVGQEIARLEGSGDPDAAALRDRYFRLPYADAMRIPSVRRDTLAQLAALQRDLAAVTARQ